MKRRSSIRIPKHGLSKVWKIDDRKINYIFTFPVRSDMTRNIVTKIVNLSGPLGVNLDEVYSIEIRSYKPDDYDMFCFLFNKLGYVIRRIEFNKINRLVVFQYIRLLFAETC